MSDFTYEMTFTMDRNCLDSINDLMKNFGFHSESELLSKAISLLRIAQHVKKTDGELIAKKGSQETRIIIE